MERAELKNLVLIGLLTLAAVYLLWIGVGPWAGVSGLRAQSAKLDAERTKLKLSVQSAEQQVARVDQIKKERAALETQLREIAKRLPSERESAEVLRSVESLAGKSGLTVAAVKRRPVRQQELYVEIPMEVGVGGGYHDLIRFADQLAQLDRLVTLSEFNVQRPTGGPGQTPGTTDGTGTIKALLVAVVFQAISEPAPAMPAPGTPAGAPKK